MKKLFPGYYRKTNEDLKALWNEAFFAFDANVLLNFYRYSPNTQHKLHQILSQLKDRIWIPYQAALEFHKNRLHVLSKQISSYDDARKLTDNLQDLLKSSREHPFVSDGILTETLRSLERLRNDLDQKKGELERFFEEDPHLDSINSLFSDRVGREPDESQAAQRIEQAKQRMANSCPPGYKDNKKDDVRSCGDAVLWLETLEFAKESKAPIILVTDDTKEDWWLIINGKTLGPRPELVKEFFDQTGKQFHLYQPGRFIEYATKHLGLEAEEEVVEEARLLTKEQAERRLKKLRTVQKRKRLFRQNVNRKFSDQSLDNIISIGEHISRHESDIKKYLDIIYSIDYGKWIDIKLPIQAPPNLVESIQSCLKSCPCIADIVESLDIISAPGYHAIADDINKYLSDESVALISAIRQMPQQATDLTINIYRHDMHDRGI